MRPRPRLLQISSTQTHSHQCGISALTIALSIYLTSYKMSVTHFFAPQVRPGALPNNFTVHNSVQPPVPHRPWPPHLPPPFSPIDGSPPAVPAYSSASPPPAYSLAFRSEAKRQLDPEAQMDDADGDDGNAQPESHETQLGDRCTTTVIVLLVILNVLVWSTVAWRVVQEGQAARLWAELQETDRIAFDI